MSVVRFIADQRTKYRVPHAACCRFLGVSPAWFYKWMLRSREDGEEVAAQAVAEEHDDGQIAPAAVVAAVGGPAPRPPADAAPDTDVTVDAVAEVVGRVSPCKGPVPFVAGRPRRRRLDAQVRVSFTASGGTYGSPRVYEDLYEAGWRVSVNTVAASMRRQALVARPKRRRRGLTRPDLAAVPFPDLLGRDFTAPAPNTRWVGDVTEIPTTSGRKLYLATVIDLYSRRLLASVSGLHPNARLCRDAITMAVAARGGPEQVRGVVFHTDRGSTYTDHTFTALCRRLGITQSMGRVGSCFDNAAAESFFSTLEHELLSRHTFATPEDAKPVVGQWCYDFYNRRRRHSKAGMLPPVVYEARTQQRPAEPANPEPEAA